MKAKDWMGQIVTFYRDPEAVKNCVITPGSDVYSGEVIGLFDVEPWGPGKIPDAGLTVRGRKGRTLRISAVANCAEHHSNWQEANAAIKNRSGQ